MEPLHIINVYPETISDGFGQGLVGIAGVTPDVFVSFLFEATEQSQQRKRVVERVAARNGDSIENGIVVYCRWSVRPIAL